MELPDNQVRPKQANFKEPAQITKKIRQEFEKEICSQNKNFRIEIFNPLDNDKEFKFFYSKDAKYYLISEKEANFQIRMYDLREGAQKPFASVLYIDGKEIQKIKTSMRRGTYFGFKKGGGEYEFFVFAEPEVSNEYSTNNSSNIGSSDPESKADCHSLGDSSKINLMENFGTIKIKFFDTKQESVSNINNVFRDLKNYIPNKRELDKKFCIRNQTVKKGRNFRRDVTYKPQISVEDEMKFLVNLTDFETKIDEVVIYYQDFIAMNIMGLISMSNIQHVKYIPNDPDYVHFAVKILRTILFEKDKSNPEMKIPALLAKFKDLTSIDFNTFLNNSKKSFEDFILEKCYKDFEIDNGSIRYKSVYEEISRTESLKIPRHPGKNKYVTRPIEHSSLHSALNISETLKCNLTNLSTGKKIKTDNNYKNFSLEDEVRKNNVLYNNIGSMNDTMYFPSRKVNEMSMEMGSNQESFIENGNGRENQIHYTLMEIDEEAKNQNKSMITVNLCDDEESETDNENILREILDE